MIQERRERAEEKERKTNEEVETGIQYNIIKVERRLEALWALWAAPDSKSEVRRFGRTPDERIRFDSVAVGRRVDDPLESPRGLY